jgi:hypothetical protein
VRSVLPWLLPGLLLAVAPVGGTPAGRGASPAAPSVEEISPATADSLAELRAALSLGTWRSLRWIGEAVLELPGGAVLPGSLELQAARRPLVEGVDYRLDAAQGRLSLLDPAWLGRPLQLRWRSLRLDLPPALSRHPAASLPWFGPDSLRAGADSLPPATLPLREEGWGEGLRASGSFLRGVSVGSGGSVGIESGLRLKVEGQIGRDVDVEAFLSDRNTPIQPEGRSQSLEEIDRIQVKVRSPRWQATLGDFDLALRPGNYLQYTRTVDGVRAGYDDGSRRALVHAASARGRFHRVEIAGREGLQGPWQLSSEQGGEWIVVLAGSERVWLDGSELARGEDRDYTIDYGLAQLSFTARRPINSDSRIIVEYQYSERVYSRALYGLETGTPLPAGASLRLGWAAERDDPDRPLDQFLDEDDRAVLAAAGDLPTQAYGSGARRVEAGTGSYRLLDSLAGRWGHYEFAEDPPPGLEDEFVWDLRFQELGRDAAGAWLGDYSRRYTASGRIYHVFEGTGGGPWAPVIPLVAPTASELLDTRLEWSAGGLRLAAEGALSRQDLNLLSSRDDGDNLGAALLGEASWRGAPIGAGPLAGGRPELGLALASEQADFRSLTPVGEVEFARIYGLQRSGAGRLLRWDGRGGWSRGDSLWWRSSLSRLERGEQRSRRFAQTWLLRPGLGPWSAGEASWRRSEAGAAAATAFRRLDLQLGFDDRGGSQSLGYESERLRTENPVQGQRHGEWRGFVERRPLPLVGASFELRRRLKEQLAAGEWIDWARVRQSRARLRLAGELAGELDWTRRRVDYALADSADTIHDIALLDLRRRGEALDWSLLYQAESRFARSRLTQYLRVDSLQGDYSEDPFQPGVFVPDPDGDYIAVGIETGPGRRVAQVQLEGGLRWQTGRGLAGETVLSLQESSRREPASDLYLLKPSAFFGDSTLSAALRWQQDLELREDELGPSSRRWRLRWEDSRQLDQLQLVAPRDSRLQRLQLRLRWRGGESRWGLQAGLRRQRLSLSGSTLGDRSVQAWRADADWSRDLSRAWLLRAALLGELARETLLEVEGRRLQVEPSLEWRAGPRGTFQWRGSWQQAWAGQERIPYELLEGARIGRTLRSNLEGRWQLGRQTRLSIGWQADALPQRQTQHTGRVQVQSFF